MIAPARRSDPPFVAGASGARFGEPGGGPHPTLPPHVVCDAADVAAYAAYCRRLLDETGAGVAGRASVGLDEALAVLDAPR